MYAYLYDWCCQCISYNIYNGDWGSITRNAAEYNSRFDDRVIEYYMNGVQNKYELAITSHGQHIYDYKQDGETIYRITYETYADPKTRPYNSAARNAYGDNYQPEFLYNDLKIFYYKPAIILTYIILRHMLHGVSISSSCHSIYRSGDL